MSTEQQAVLKTNEAFYRAFSNNDIASMEELWSTQVDIAVIHPGWAPLRGRESVMSSWNQIMTGATSSPITCVNAKANILGDVALVICTEILEEIELIATNTFVLESGEWKIIHHQAGPLPQSNNIHEGDILH
jgi:ketosteroid isomerase-like protein